LQRSRRNYIYIIQAHLIGDPMTILRNLMHDIATCCLTSLIAHWRWFFCLS
jgi:hypothetical protein